MALSSSTFQIPPKYSSTGSAFSSQNPSTSNPAISNPSTSFSTSVKFLDPERNFGNDLGKTPGNDLGKTPENDSENNPEKVTESKYASNPYYFELNAISEEIGLCRKKASS